ncbi:carbohydrate ABC transporter membrane protein 2, CUT1 family (TC 3.A.1.1.-) [Planifilum fulgidum]|uniref:Carbohydrate ABC transporter membrane protein 2, CUT1 family (TC 3.A.1.1.-) n=1 Tax=Planifilum fulgidum TaxID=201973 RepID=A0A1I2MXG8_9BACL|nr:carbohydrate ABC transporter permease [Planifilum fulgidum]SFF96123.1 carbohydrate ABC transporter membrane protein 2, CUT1 family (TC 3.A.1.1.-) [Planifilum fulgidum]
MSRRSAAKTALRHAVLMLVTFVMVYPILWMFFSSFKPDEQIFSTSNLWPETWTLDHYVSGFMNMNFGRLMLNSLIISTVVVVGTIFSSSLTGFAFARLRFTPRRFLIGFMLSTMMLPAQVVMIPQYIMFHKIGWVNTFLPLTLPSFLGTVPFFIYLMVQFVRGIPKELDEAAYIDGCSKFQLFRLIIFPLARPAIITMSIFAFYWTWNDFFGQLIYLSDPELHTVSLGLSMFIDSTGSTQWGDLFAMSILSVVPVFIVFLFFQRYLVEGIATHGLKG